MSLLYSAHLLQMHKHKSVIRENGMFGRSKSWGFGVKVVGAFCGKRAPLCSARQIQLSRTGRFISAETPLLIRRIRQKTLTYIRGIAQIYI